MVDDLSEKGLGGIGHCIECGASMYTTYINTDHLYPRCLTGPANKRSLRHPLHEVIYQPYNEFAMCLDHHTALDMGKTNAFLGLPSDDIEVVRAVGKVNRGDPEALIQFLIENYPITTDRKYFEAQIAAMLRTNALFAETIKYLNGEFCLELKTRYQKAAVLALVFNKKLRELTPPPFVLPPLLTS